MPNYSLTRNAQGDVPVDGFRAYRFVHWLVKIVTGALFTAIGYGIGYLVGGRLAWALGAAIVSLLICKSFNIKWTMPRSTWTPKGLDPFTRDFLFDFVLNLVAWLFLVHVGWPVWLVAGAVLISTYPYASP